MVKVSARLGDRFFLRNTQPTLPNHRVMEALPQNDNNNSLCLASAIASLGLNRLTAAADLHMGAAMLANDELWEVSSQLARQVWIETAARLLFDGSCSAELSAALYSPGGMRALVPHQQGGLYPPFHGPHSSVASSFLSSLASIQPAIDGIRQSVIQMAEKGGRVLPMCFNPVIALGQLHRATTTMDETASGLSHTDVSGVISPSHFLHFPSAPASSLCSSSTTTTAATNKSSLGDTTPITTPTTTHTVNRLSYSREFKLAVIEDYVANGQNKYRTCKKFHITKSMLNSWLQKEAKIRASKPGSLKSGRSGRRPQFPAIERRLVELYLKQKEEGVKVKNKWLRETARSLALQENQLARGQESQNTTSTIAPCQFSERWLSNFKKRHGVPI